MSASLLLRFCTTREQEDILHPIQLFLEANLLLEELTTRSNPSPLLRNLHSQRQQVGSVLGSKMVHCTQLKSQASSLSQVLSLLTGGGSQSEPSEQASWRISSSVHFWVGFRSLSCNTGKDIDGVDKHGQLSQLLNRLC